MGFLEILGFGKKAKSNKENIMPADSPFPSGIEKGDKVKIRDICREYRDGKWNICFIDSFLDIYFKKNYNNIVFEAINCKGEIYGEIYIELFAEENNKTYDIYVKFDMIEPYIQKQAEPVNYNNNYNSINNRTSIRRGNISGTNVSQLSQLSNSQLVAILDIPPRNLWHFVPNRKAIFFELLKRANYDSEAMFYLGCAYQGGHINPDWTGKKYKCIPTAIDYYRKAERAGYGYAGYVANVIISSYGNINNFSYHKYKDNSYKFRIR